MTKFIIRQAVPADSEFISIGIREAERCNVGIGIYDVLIGQTFKSIESTDRECPDAASRYLEYASLNDSNSHIYVNNFLVVVEESSGHLAACCCNFPYPEFKLSTSIVGFELALKEVLGYSEEQAKKAFDNWSFLDASFPDVEYDHSWMMEAVYVAPRFRGQGLAHMIVKANMDAQCGRKSLVTDSSEPDRRYLITCAVGNDAAKAVYEKLGFKVIGQGNSEECQKAIHCAGFYVLSTQ